jgi:hypothetical protein
VCLTPPAGSAFGPECTVPGDFPRSPVLHSAPAVLAAGAVVAWLHANAPAVFAPCPLAPDFIVGAQDRGDGALLLVYNTSSCANRTSPLYPKVWLCLFWLF